MENVPAKDATIQEDIIPALIPDTTLYANTSNLSMANDHTEVAQNFEKIRSSISDIIPTCVAGKKAMVKTWKQKHNETVLFVRRYRPRPPFENTNRPRSPVREYQSTIKHRSRVWEETRWDCCYLHIYGPNSKNVSYNSCFQHFS